MVEFYLKKNEGKTLTQNKTDLILSYISQNTSLKKVTRYLVYSRRVPEPRQAY